MTFFILLVEESGGKDQLHKSTAEYPASLDKVHDPLSEEGRS